MELDWSLSSAPKPVRDDTDDRSRVRLMIANTFPPSFIKLRHFNLILCKLGSSFQVIHINDNWETVRINCNYNSIRRFYCIYQNLGPEELREGLVMADHFSFPGQNQLKWKSHDLSPHYNRKKKYFTSTELKQNVLC